jgi:rare lipoprotein A
MAALSTAINPALTTFLKTKFTQAPQRVSVVRWGTHLCVWVDGMRSLGYGLILTAAVGLALAGCSDSKKKKNLDPFAGVGAPYYKGSGPVPKGTGRAHVGKPYQVAGRWFTPKIQPGYDKTGPASWYGEAFHRRKTSNGEWFDMNELTAAHPTLPLPSYAKVTNLENGRQVVVRINDRGPFVGPRIIDLSKRTSEVLGFKHQGKVQVRVQLIGDAPLRDDGRHLMAMNRELGQGASLRQLAQYARGDVNTQVAAAEPTYEQPDEPVQQATYRPPATSKAYVINVGTFSDPENAAAASNMLAEYGANLVPVQTDDGTVYRVQIGPLTERGDIQAAMQAAQDAGFVDAKIMTTRIEQVASN